MIEYWRQQIARLQMEKQRFINLQNALSSSVVPSINNVKGIMEGADSSIKESFLVDNESADDKSIKNNAIKLSELSSTITGGVLPAISSEIARINSEIAYYQGLIAAELARRAAEAAAAAAAANSGGGSSGKS